MSAVGCVPASKRWADVEGSSGGEGLKVENEAAEGAAFGRVRCDAGRESSRSAGSEDVIRLHGEASVAGEEKERARPSEGEGQGGSRRRIRCGTSQEGERDAVKRRRASLAEVAKEAPIAFAPYGAERPPNRLPAWRRGFLEHPGRNDRDQRLEASFASDFGEARRSEGRRGSDPQKILARMRLASQLVLERVDGDEERVVVKVDLPMRKAERLGRA